jgi:predicted TIM-barrel fold metal-dependent hydrolase
LPLVLEPLLKLGLKVVVDHFGRVDPALGVDDPGFRYLLSTGASRQVWSVVGAVPQWRQRGGRTFRRPGMAAAAPAPGDGSVAVGQRLAAYPA